MSLVLLSHPQWLFHKYKALMKAVLVNLPFRPPTGKTHGTGGTLSARYCYSVWLRHLVIARKNGLKGISRVVAELGPGDSLGIGLAALLSGAREYYALDVVHHADPSRNLAVFEELVELFRKRAPIPDRQEFPGVKPFLDCYDFPSNILSEEYLSASLDPARVESIRKAVQGKNDGSIAIRYFVPWNKDGTIRPGSVDFIFSQAVLEYVDDLPAVYAALHRWLKPGGFMSHQIDFKSHGITEPWNGHWAFSDGEWKVLKGRRPYFLNRALFSAHLNEQGRAGFTTVGVQKLEHAAETGRTSALPKEFLARRYRDCSDEELAVSGALIQTCKPGN